MRLLAKFKSASASARCVAVIRNPPNPSGSFRHRLHEERKGLPKALGPGRCPFVMTQTHHDQVMRWNNQRGLAARAVHVVCLSGHRKRAGAVDPEEGSVNRALVSLPGGGQRTYEPGVPFW